MDVANIPNIMYQIYWHLSVCLGDSANERPCSPASSTKPSWPDLSMTLLSGYSCTQSVLKNTPYQNGPNNGSFKTSPLKQTGSQTGIWAGPDSEPATQVCPAHPGTTILLFATCLPQFTSFPLISLIYVCSDAEQLGDFPVERLILKHQKIQENRLVVTLALWMRELIDDKNSQDLTRGERRK